MISKYKQVIIVRGDLNISKGKLAVQVAHAAILGYLSAEKNIRKKWLEEGQKKIVLRAKNLEELLKIKSDAEKIGLKAEVVRDAGLTELEPGTVTALVIGPDEKSRIDEVTGRLPLL